MAIRDRLKNFIYRNERLTAAYEWLLERWPMLVVRALIAAVVGCLIALTVMMLTD